MEGYAKKREARPAHGAEGQGAGRGERETERERKEGRKEGREGGFTIPETPLLTSLVRFQLLWVSAVGVILLNRIREQ